MAYADYRDLIDMTQDLLKSLAIHIHGNELVQVPIFDINAKAITKGPEKSEKLEKKLEIDFRGDFTSFSVMDELGLDPLDLGNLEILRPKLQQMMLQHMDDQNVIQTMNDKQLFDKLIENRIEKKSMETNKPCFIKDHPLLMSPLAKSHA